MKNINVELNKKFADKGDILSSVLKGEVEIKNREIFDKYMQDETIFPLLFQKWNLDLKYLHSFGESFEVDEQILKVLDLFVRENQGKINELTDEEIKESINKIAINNKPINFYIGKLKNKGITNHLRFVDMLNGGKELEVEFDFDKKTKNTGKTKI